MLFNSYTFLFFFLPVVLTGFFTLCNTKKNYVLIWIICASLFFYGWWNPKFVLLIIFSSIINYFFGKLLMKIRQNKKLSTLLLIFSLIFNLSVLCYFKYFNFFIENLNYVFNLSLPIQNIILPIGISFYTFIQIAYLIDIYKGIKCDYTFLEYFLFVTFFPHLLAGPIIHHQELIPQLKEDNFCKVKYSNISVGITIFFIGLFKKVALADNVAVYANAIFDTAGKGVQLTLFESWLGALSYSLQLYFDFSGYSDMAIGLARMFNIWFPINFNSPYKAISIIDFWHRWHITLSRFFRDYLYIPLGGNKKGFIRRYFNLITTMFIVGMWHGAGWTFILWGLFHGVLLGINHIWRSIAIKIDFKNIFFSNIFYLWIKRLSTFIVVVFLWVIFRSKDFKEALIIWKGMVGIGGISIHEALIKSKVFSVFNNFLDKIGVSIDAKGFFPNIVNLKIDSKEIFISISILLFICWVLPNTQEFMSQFKPALFYEDEQNNGVQKKFQFKWQPNLLWFILILIMVIYTIGIMDNVKEFLYYQF